MSEPYDPNPPAAFAPMPPGQPSLGQPPLGSRRRVNRRRVSHRWGRSRAGRCRTRPRVTDHRPTLATPGYQAAPGYSSAGYAPGYGPAGYGPAGYGPGYGLAGYAPYGYPPAYAGFPPRDSRPGLVAASGVLAFVEAGLLVASGLLLLLGASFVDAMSTDLTSEDHSTVVWLALGGVLNLVVATSAVVGGILLTRRLIGRWWLSAAAAVDLVCALVWLVDHPGSFILAALLTAPMILAAAFAWPQRVTRWLSAER